MSTELAIWTHDLTRRFGPTLAVDRLCLEVRAGEVFGFLGHNGAGKTTTVRLLNGILEADGGSARVLGLSPATDGPALRRRTGVLTETPSLDERLSAWENLAFYAELYAVPPAEAARRVGELLETFDLTRRERERVSSYSKGMKQRLALARALLHQPDLLFLDEPTAALDPAATRQVHELITRLSQQGRTVFLCTHNLAEAQQLCDRVAVLAHGHVLAQGAPTELWRQLGQSLKIDLEVDRADLPRALSILRSLPMVSEASAEGTTITLSGAGREGVPEVLAALVPAAVRVYRVSPREPSLEEVYFALQGYQEPEPDGRSSGSAAQAGEEMSA